MQPIIIQTHGEYYFKKDNQKGRKTYSLSVKAPSLEFFNQTTIKSKGTDENGKIVVEEKVFLNVRGILKKRLVPAILSKKVSDFARIRSVVIDEITCSAGQALKLPINLLSVAQLGVYIKKNEYPIDHTTYMDVGELRTDVMACEENVDVFLANKRKADQTRTDEKAFMELNELNDGAEIQIGSEVKSNLVPDKKPEEVIADVSAPATATEPLAAPATPTVPDM